VTQSVSARIKNKPRIPQRQQPPATKNRSKSNELARREGNWILGGQTKKGELEPNPKQDARICEPYQKPIHQELFFVLFSQMNWRRIVGEEEGSGVVMMGGGIAG
jgi:hypothetical protein